MEGSAERAGRTRLTIDTYHRAAFPSTPKHKLHNLVMKLTLMSAAP